MKGQWITAKYAGRCVICREGIMNGDQVYLGFNGAGLHCRACGNKLYARAIDKAEASRAAYARAKALGYDTAPKKPTRKAIQAAIDMNKP